MIDTRTVGQLQEQVRSATRQGRQRLTVTARNLTATAQLVRPQLPSVPKPSLSLPAQARIREIGPAIAARLPSPDQLRSGAQDLAAMLFAAQRRLAQQALAAATPLARQAASVLTGNPGHQDKAGDGHSDDSHRGQREVSAKPAKNGSSARKSGPKPGSKSSAR